MALRCWLFGHEWGPWFDHEEDDFPDKDFPDNTEHISTSRCSRCGCYNLVWAWRSDGEEVA